MRNTRKGFTLVELLAVIVILAVILVIAVPQILNVIDSTKIGSMESSTKLVAKSAERYYNEKEILGEKVGEINCSKVVQISNEDYSSCNIKFINGKAYVTIEGSGKFNGYSCIKGTKENPNCTKDGKYPLIVELNNGISSQEFESRYTASSTLELTEPTRIGFTFTGWSVEGNGSSINGSTLTMGSTTTKITANFEGIGREVILASGEMMKDETPDENLRYVGENPNNYVLFNNELWRIIGIFNISNGTTTQPRIKLIRNESIGKYSWDSSDSNMNSGNGYNVWETLTGKQKADGTTKADLNILLNDYYYNGKDNQTCYIGKNAELSESQTICNFSSIGLNNKESRALIEQAVWNLGGNKYDPAAAPCGLYTLTQYNAERATNIYYSDISQTSWTGIVGLPYASDYGYASTDIDCRTNLRAGVTYINSTYDFSGANCRKSLGNWMDNSENDWLFSSKNNNSSQIFITSIYGYMTFGTTYVGHETLPTVYLKSNVKIIGGMGTSAKPYKLSL